MSPARRLSGGSPGLAWKAAVAFCQRYTRRVAIRWPGASEGTRSNDQLTHCLKDLCMPQGGTCLVLELSLSPSSRAVARHMV